MLRFILSVLFLGTTTLLTAQYQLMWSDEFNGSALDPFKWVYEIGNGCPNLCGWGNNEWQYYTSNTANIDVDSGYLRITGVKESYQGSNYTSARIKTEGRFDFKYGKIEARIQMPMGKGIWPAFWMLGANISTVSWPQCGEIDVMEHINMSPYINGTVHYNGPGGYTYNGDQTLCDVTTFHVYAVEWDANSVKWFVDGNQYHEINIQGGNNSTEEFHYPFFIIFNMAIGGNWPGYPDNTTPFPANMLVDYVRVYQLSTPISKINVEELTLYPNPAHSTLQLETEATIQSYTIYSADGKVLQRNRVQNTTIDITALDTGLYFIMLEDLDGVLYQHKFIKE